MHLGFILKLEGSSNSQTQDKSVQSNLRRTLEKGAEYLQKGLATKEPSPATQKMVDDVRVPSGRAILGKQH